MTIPKAPDAHSAWRGVGRIKIGWHVLAGERWLRIDDALGQHNSIVLVSGDIAVQVSEGDCMWTRTPAEQFLAVCAALPMRNRIGVPKLALGSPFVGSAPTPVSGLESPHDAWTRK